jgi:hypothetical protein
MRFRTLLPHHALVLALILTVGTASAQTAEEIACLADPACQVEDSVAESPISNLDNDTQATSEYENTFLMKRQRRLVGIPGMANDESQIRDYIEAPPMTGNPYWNAYGTGAYYMAVGNNAMGNQLWHVNFGTGEHRQVTNGDCIPGVKPTSRNWRCGYLAPVAHVPGSLAFVQQIVEVIDGDDNSRIPETPQWQVVISVDGSATGVISLDRKPDHLSWRPDGEWLVFVESSEMLAVSAAGKVCVLPQVAEKTVRHAEWTNAGGGGGTIVYETEGSIWTVPVKKMNRRSVCPELQLAKKQRLTDDGGQDRDPQWLEKSNLIAFISNRPLSPGDTSRQNRIWAVPAGRAAPIAFVFMPFSINYADWQISRTTPQKAQIGAAPKGRGGRD